MKSMIYALITLVFFAINNQAGESWEATTSACKYNANSHRKHEVVVPVIFNSISYDMECRVSIYHDNVNGYAGAEISWPRAAGAVTVWCSNGEIGTVQDSKSGTLNIGNDDYQPDYIYLIAHAFITGNVSSPDEAFGHVYMNW